MRIQLALVLATVLAAGCARSGAAPAEPEEPRDVDPSIPEQIRDDAQKTLEDCEEPIEVLLLEGTAEQATYLTSACGHVYSYAVACRRQPQGSRGGSGPLTCMIAESEEVDPAEAPELLDEARRHQAGSDANLDE